MKKDRLALLIFSNSCFQEIKHKLYRDESPYHIENSPLICSTNQWTGFSMIGTSDMDKLTASNSLFRISNKFCMLLFD